MTCLPPQVMLLRDAALWRLALSPGVRYASIVTKANQRRRMPLRLRSCAAGGFGNRTTQVRPRTCRRAAKRARRARWGRNTADASMLDSGTAERSPNDAICRRRRCVPAAAGWASAAPGRESGQAAQTPAMRRVAADPLTSAPLDAAARRGVRRTALVPHADSPSGAPRMVPAHASGGAGLPLATVAHQGAALGARRSPPWPTPRAVEPRASAGMADSDEPSAMQPARLQPASRPVRGSLRARRRRRAVSAASASRAAGGDAASPRAALPCFHRATCSPGCAVFRAFAGLPGASHAHLQHARGPRAPRSASASRVR